MGETQTVDYDALAKQHGAVASQATTTDYDSLAKQHGAVSSATPTEATGSIGAYHPSVSQRVGDFFFPLVEHLRMGGAASDERLLAPEKLMTPEQREAHPIVAGAADVAGGLTTGSNLALMGASGGLGELPGVAGRVIPRVASGLFSAETLRGVYDEVPDFRAAYERGDTSEALRIFTHITLGAGMAALGGQHAATGGKVSGQESADITRERPSYEARRKDGGLLDRLSNLRHSRGSIQEAGTKLYQGRVQRTMQTITGALKQDAASIIQGAVDADKQAQPIKGQGSISTSSAVSAMTEAQLRTGASQSLLDPFIRRLNNDPFLDLEKTKQLRSDVGDAARRLSRSPSTQAESASLTAAYDELGKGMKERITELQGTSKPYEAYNEKFRTYYKMLDGIAGDMQEGLVGREGSIAQLEKFATANLAELKEYAATYGVAGRELDRLQQHAKSVVNAHKSNGLKFGSIWSALRQSPSFPTGAGGLAGYVLGSALGVPGFILAGAGATAGAKLGVALRDYPVVSKLNRSLPAKTGRILPEPIGPQRFDYPNQDDLYNPPGGSGTPPAGAPENPQAAKISALKDARARKGGSRL